MALQVVACRTRVKTLMGGVCAMVTGICIREGSITYEISYFHNGERKSEWLNRYEFEIDAQTGKKAGFVIYDKPVDESAHMVPLLPEHA